MTIHRNTQHHTAEGRDNNIHLPENSKLYILKIDAEDSSETSTPIYHSTQRHIPEYSKLNIHRPENRTHYAVYLYSPVMCLDSIRSLLSLSGRPSAAKVCQWLNNSWRECFYCSNSHCHSHCEGNCSPIKPFEQSIVSGETEKSLQ